MQNKKGTMLQSHAEVFDSFSQSGAHRLPPLILHPFSAADDAALLLESSRASLVLNGSAPSSGTPSEELDAKLLQGRYAELRMLFYIGKDVTRWMEQCTETMQAMPNDGRRWQPESFALYLVQHVPQQVREKLESWGVSDYCALFRRSVAFHVVFSGMPAANQLTADFLRQYHRHLDRWWEYRMRESFFDRGLPGEFSFELYASGEYTLMLERSWSDANNSDQ